MGDDALGASSKSSLHNQLDRLRSLNVVKDLYETTQESKPAPTSSPFELLRQVEHDVRDRLANLYQGKNFILSHQADIWANGKAESPASGNKEEMLHATMERLQKMENAYEMLGTTILESLKEVERMEEDFHVLQSELETNGCPLLTISHKKKKSKKSSHKGKKKGASSESDSMNTGSSRSESSSAQSSSRPTNSQAEDLSSGKDVEQPSNSKGVDEKNIEAGGKAESKSSLKTKKKNPSQKNEKKKGAKLEGKDDVANQENTKRPSPTSAEASTPPQASSPSASSPVAEATPLNAAALEDRGQVFMSASPGIIPNINNNASSERALSGAPVQEGAKPPSSDAEGQVVDVRPGSAELPRSSEGTRDLLGVQTTLTLPKISLTAQDVRDVKPSDSASLQILPKPKRKSRRMSSEVSKDEIVQTDDVAILSLEDCDVDTLRLREYQAADIKDLLENMKKMQKQLQFWRTKNWAEKHTGQGHMMPPPVYNQFIKVDASPDMGMMCYYNPRSGVHVMKNVSDLDTIMQQSIMNLFVGPSHAL